MWEGRNTWKGEVVGVGHVELRDTQATSRTQRQTQMVVCQGDRAALHLTHRLLTSG